MSQQESNVAVSGEAGASKSAAFDLSGKYLTFKLADEDYGLEILKVREIIGLMGITVVPRTPAYIRGVINLRGKVIPVVDLRLKFSMPPNAKEDPTDALVVVVEYDGRQAALLTDADWVWFTDCDLMFRDDCLDVLVEQLQGRRDAQIQAHKAIAPATSRLIRTCRYCENYQ